MGPHGRGHEAFGHLHVAARTDVGHPLRIGRQHGRGEGNVGIFGQALPRLLDHVQGRGHPLLGNADSHQHRMLVGGHVIEQHLAADAQHRVQGGAVGFRPCDVRQVKVHFLLEGRLAGDLQAFDGH